ncbi:carboxymuconolactone decarboxylase family protein [Azospirillum picis]|uniref:carboxymuconolactone decarboxylase family protein n=1 Tax=Azospirillum picis TaxID=488438 RepID=UPI001AE51106|nr:carboxymuconolactone decarboxylase family protein [Azospirillum picis]
MSGELSGAIRDRPGSAPGVLGAFSGMARAALKPDALDPGTKEPIAPAIAVAIRCDGCVAFHAEAAMRQGATRAEVMGTVGMAAYRGAGRPVMSAAQAVEAFDQFTRGAGRNPGRPGGKVVRAVGLEPTYP